MKTGFLFAVLCALLVCCSAQDEYPPIDDHWRCLEDPNGMSGVVEPVTWQDIFAIGDLRQDDECEPVTPEVCTNGADYYPYPCNCHAYIRCVPTENPNFFLPCIYKCEPYDLIFDPNTGVCEYVDEAPPALCADTPPPPNSTVASSTITTSSTSTSTYTPTFTTINMTTSDEPTTTPEPPPPTDCVEEGDTFPYPGDCHMYYVCRLDDDEEFYIDIFDCGELIYDPNTASCQFPDEACELLCGPDECDYYDNLY